MTNPTTQSYISLSKAYDSFNQALFNGTLPSCLITLQRHRGSFGYFSGSRFAKTTNPKEVTDEIALNPTHFATRPVREVLATLAHEMVHLWQHHHGTPPRRGYHDRQWAAKMQEIGLIPTDTGKAGGRQTGQKVTHFIAEEGAYARAFATLSRAGAATLYADQAGEQDDLRKKKAASKTKYTCPDCGLNAWAKPEVSLLCGGCEEEMSSAS